MEKVFDATQIQRLSLSKDEEAKPHCLILDEIDGAQDGESKSAIRALIDFVTGKVSQKAKGRKGAKTKQNDQPEAEGREEVEKDEKEEGEIEQDIGIDTVKSKQVTIKRPIVCICNDLYGKSLAQLRKIALVFNVKGMDVSNMISSLKDICGQEKVTIPMDLLTNLCIQSKCDMRSCLNTLQLVSAQSSQSGRRSINREMLFAKNTNRILNSKDNFQGIFEIWNEICTTASGERGNRSIKQIREIIMRHDSPGFLLDGIYFNCLSNGSENLNALSTFYVTVVTNA